MAKTENEIQPETENVVDESEVVETEVEATATTAVKIGLTKLKYFNEETNLVEDREIVGRFTLIECKKMVQQWNDKNVFINKENLTEEFRVNSEKLYQLKGL